MRILGIDPGYGRCGYAVLGPEGLISVGIITTKAHSYFPQRLLEIKKDFITLLDRFSPTIVGLEDQFFMQNVTTGLKLAQVRGVLLCACAERGINTQEPKPTAVKSVFTGHGQASKAEMRQMVKKMYGTAPKIDDAADAIAVAFWVKHHKPFLV